MRTGAWQEIREKDESEHDECQSDFHIRRCKCLALWRMFLDGGLVQSAHAESHEESKGREGTGMRGECDSLKVTPQIAWMILETQSGFFGLHSVATERQGSRLEYRSPPKAHNRNLISCYKWVIIFDRVSLDFYRFGLILFIRTFERVPSRLPRTILGTELYG